MGTLFQLRNDTICLMVPMNLSFKTQMVIALSVVIACPLQFSVFCNIDIYMHEYYTQRKTTVWLSLPGHYMVTDEAL